MPRRVALRRTYHGFGCISPDTDSLLKGQVGDVEFWIGCNRYPVLPVLQLEYPRTVSQMPGFGIAGGKQHINVKIGSAKECGFHGKAFLDIFCWTHVHDSSDDLPESMKVQLSETADAAAAVAGLTLGNQLLIEHVFDGLYWPQLKNPKTLNEAAYTINFHTVQVRHVKRVPPIKTVEMEFRALMARARAHHHVLRWLWKAWSETDSLLKFLSFFIPLEMILEGVEPQTPDNQAFSLRLKAIVKQHAGNDASFINYVNTICRPSLNQRFEAIARKAGLDSADSDIKTFKKCNQLRNKLLHHGEHIERTTVAIDPLVAALCQLAERYVKWVMLNSEVDHRANLGGIGS